MLIDAIITCALRLSAGLLCFFNIGVVSLSELFFDKLPPPEKAVLLAREYIESYLFESSTFDGRLYCKISLTVSAALHLPSPSLGKIPTTTRSMLGCLDRTQAEDVVK